MCWALYLFGEMSIKPENINIEFDSNLIDISPLVIRRGLYKVDDKHAEETQELQFQVKNITDKNLVGLEAELEYSSSNNGFEGFDSDLRLEVLTPSDTHNFALFIDPPKNYSDATLKLNIRKQTIGDRIPSSVTWILLGLVMIAVLYSKLK